MELAQTGLFLMSKEFESNVIRSIFEAARHGNPS